MHPTTLLSAKSLRKSGAGLEMANLNGFVLQRIRKALGLWKVLLLIPMQNKKGLKGEINHIKRRFLILAE